MIVANIMQCNARHLILDRGFVLTWKGKNKKSNEFRFEKKKDLEIISTYKLNYLNVTVSKEAIENGEF